MVVIKLIITLDLHEAHVKEVELINTPPEGRGHVQGRIPEIEGKQHIFYALLDWQVFVVFFLSSSSPLPQGKLVAY
jgi:hypothetical protein